VTEKNSHNTSVLLECQAKRFGTHLDVSDQLPIGNSAVLRDVTSNQLHVTSSNNVTWPSCSTVQNLFRAGPALGTAKCQSYCGTPPLWFVAQSKTSNVSLLCVEAFVTAPEQFNCCQVENKEPVSDSSYNMSSSWSELCEAAQARSLPEMLNNLYAWGSVLVRCRSSNPSRYRHPQLASRAFLRNLAEY
jgi:hypothetical protein